jgi:hypothetical protein
VNEEREPTIWIVNEAGHPYYHAKDTIPEGRAKFIPFTTGNVNPFHVDRHAKEIARGISRYARENDYVLVCSLPVLNFLVGAIWLQNFPSVQLLIWDAKNSEYVIRKVERENLARHAEV